MVLLDHLPQNGKPFILLLSHEIVVTMREDVSEGLKESVTMKELADDDADGPAMRGGGLREA